MRLINLTTFYVVKWFYFIKSGEIDQSHHILCSKLIYFIECDGIEKKYLFFLILQCQWHKHGSEVLENPSSSFEVEAIPTMSLGFASGHWRYWLNLSGFGGYFPIPPRHAYAIVSFHLKTSEIPQLSSCPDVCKSLHFE